jgi:hypothetical protein
MVTDYDNYVTITKVNCTGKRTAPSVKTGGTYTDRCAAKRLHKDLYLKRLILSGDITLSKCSRSVKIQHFKLSRCPSLSAASLLYSACVKIFLISSQTSECKHSC